MIHLNIAPSFLETFADKEDLFNQIMAIEGKALRALEGRRTIRFERAGKVYYIKQHFGIGWKEVIKNLLQWRLPVLGAETEWRAIRAFQDVGLPTLKIVGYGKRGWIPARQQSFLITEELENVTSLEDFCKTWPAHKPRFSLKQALLKSVAQIAQTLHRHGLNHRDFYLCHFLLKNDSTALKEPVLYLIDLHRVQRRARIPLRWRLKDIAGLYFSVMDIGLTRYDIFRFLKWYYSKSLREILQQEANDLSKIEQKATALYRKTFQKMPVPFCRVSSYDGER